VHLLVVYTFYKLLSISCT